MDLLLAHAWPGNVREFRNTIARLVVFPQLGKDALLPPTRAVRGDALAPLVSLPLSEARGLVLEQFERNYVDLKLRENGGNITRAAESMGVSRQLVHRLIDRYGIRSRE